MSQLSSVGTTTSQYTIPGATQAYSNILSGYRNQLAGLEQSVTGGLGNLYGQALRATGQFGATQRAQTINAYLQQQAQQGQGLMDRGLGNSTISNSINTGLLQNEQLNLTNVAQLANQQKLQAMGQFGLPVYQAAEQMGMQGLSAQQQLGQQYLQMLAQQGIQTQQTSQQQTQTPTFNPFGQGGSISFRDQGNRFGMGGGGGGGPSPLMSNYGGEGTGSPPPPSGFGGGYGGMDLGGYGGGMPLTALAPQSVYSGGSVDTSGGGTAGSVDPGSLVDPGGGE